LWQVARLWRERSQKGGGHAARRGDHVVKLL